MPPTYDVEPRFEREFRRLTRANQRQFIKAKDALVAGLREGVIPPRLRVKRVQRHARAWELSWAPDGRATFEYGPEQRPGEAHVIWRRVGNHRILDDP